MSVRKRCLLIALSLWCSTRLLAAPLAGFDLTGAFGEQARWITQSDGARIYINAPASLQSHAALPTEVVVYATPNGSTIEQSLGGQLPADANPDWRFDIQHVAAQVRLLRNLETDRKIVLIVAQAAEKSWPTYRHVHADAPKRVRSMIADVCRGLPGSSIHLTLSGHSGGGAFLWSYLDGGETVADDVDRIAFLDANYSYSDDAHHGDKLLAWLHGNSARHLIILAYDDREITLNGRKVLSDTGGTYRASHRMIDRFAKDWSFTTDHLGPFERWTGMKGQVLFYIHPNPENKILHTALIGEMSGLLQALTVGTPQEKKWGTFGGPRAYTAWVGLIASTQPASSISLIPPRSNDAPPGSVFARSIAELPTPQREAAVEQQVLLGNIPDFLRHFHTIRIQAKLADGKLHQLELQVALDYLSVGSDADFVRMPLTPVIARTIAEKLSCSLPTTKIVDEIHRSATLKLQPAPLVENREAMATFMLHNQIIELERQGHAVGELVDGIKKDVVLTNRLRQAPTHVAIYGWEYLDGKPIQPLTTVHKGSYVDYSHGIRLVRQRVTVDGQVSTLAAVLKDPLLHPLLSDEGGMDISTMYTAAPATQAATLPGSSP